MIPPSNLVADVTGDLDLVQCQVNLILVIASTENPSVPKIMIVEELSIAKTTETKETIIIPEMIVVGAMIVDLQVHANIDTDVEVILLRSTDPENIDLVVTILKTAEIEVVAVTEKIENLGEALTTEVKMIHAQNQGQKKLFILISKRKNNQT